MAESLGDPPQEDSPQVDLPWVGQSARRLAFTVEYEGTNYAGFQFQAHQPTIQGELESAINHLTKEDTRVRAASRTDSGTHALGQVIDFLTGSPYPVSTFVNALNYYLPNDIRIQQGFEMQPEFHSRRDAASRIYRYQILNRPRPSPLQRREWHWIREPLQIDVMNDAAQDLVGIHDFRPLAVGHPPEKSAVRTVHRWDARRDSDKIVIKCESTGFLRHQIRRANAILVEIGKGKWPKDTIRVLLGNRDENEPGAATRPRPWPSLPALGLCLVEVTYRDFWSKVKIQNETY